MKTTAEQPFAGDTSGKVPAPKPGAGGSRHRIADSRGSLRAAVFDVNNGVASNRSLILGVAETAHDSQIVPVSDIAELPAWALSMSKAEYISVRSQRDLAKHPIRLERDELQLNPAQEALYSSEMHRVFCLAPSV